MCDSATLRLCFQPLSREKGEEEERYRRGTGRKQTRRLADSRPESAHVLAESDVILKHCRCSDCRSFSQTNGDYFCSEDIGGTKVTWLTGKRECDPPPAAWHYCSPYDGPQISKDVLVWPKAPPSAKERPAPGGGRPGSGPNADRPGGNQSDGPDDTQPVGPDASGFAPATPRAAQGGAGWAISVEVEPEADQTPNAKGVRP